MVFLDSKKNIHLPFYAIFDDLFRWRMYARYKAIQNADSVRHPRSSLTNHLRVETEKYSSAKDRHTDALRYNYFYL